MTDGQWFDRFCQGLRRASIANSHLDSAKYYENAACPRCGNCTHWMTEMCPREHHANGRRRGPSCDAPRCDKYTENSSVEKLRQMAAQQKQMAREALYEPEAGKEHENAEARRQLEVLSREASGTQQ